VAVLALVAGSGGGSDDDPLTGTAATVALPSANVRTGTDGSVTAIATIGASSHSGDTRADTAEAFGDYVGELEPILQPVMDFEAMTSRVTDIFDDLSQTPDDSWDDGHAAHIVAAGDGPALAGARRGAPGLAGPLRPGPELTQVPQNVW
jgi:hypothetical protein